MRSNRQVILTALARTSPAHGPALTVTGQIPDIDHFKGSFGGRVFPLWSDGESKSSNLQPRLLEHLGKTYGTKVSSEDLLSYIVALTAHHSFTARFRADLATPGLRIPLTADRASFQKVADLGRTIIWLHTFGEPMADLELGRPAGPPRLPAERRLRIPAEGEIPQDREAMPDAIAYDATTKRLLIGTGYVDNVEPEVWNYEVSGKKVLRQWFSYRQKNRERPIIGDRRPPSPLAFVGPDPRTVPSAKTKHKTARRTSALRGLA